MNVSHTLSSARYHTTVETNLCTVAAFVTDSEITPTFESTATNHVSSVRTSDSELIAIIGSLSNPLDNNKKGLPPISGSQALAPPQAHSSDSTANNIRINGRKRQQLPGDRISRAVPAGALERS